MKKPKYEVREGSEWYRCKKGEPQSSGWLHFELSDGTIGLAQPKNWRVVGAETVAAVKGDQS